MAAPRLTASERERIIALEFSHLGHGERPPGSNRTEYGAWFGLNGNAWCAMSQSFFFYKVLGRSPFPATTSKGFAACVSGANWFRSRGAWASASTTPQRGWLIFFKWPGDSIEHHIGLVLDAGSPRSVNTIEGNTSDKVQLHHRSSSIAGYGIINYVNDLPKPGPKPAPVPTFHPVKMGDSGPVVKQVQGLLHWFATKYKARDVDAAQDGQFGPKTATAVKNFKKRQHDLQVAFHQKVTFTTPFNSIVGPVTFNSLRFWASA